MVPLNKPPVPNHEYYPFLLTDPHLYLQQQQQQNQQNQQQQNILLENNNNNVNNINNNNSTATTTTTTSTSPTTTTETSTCQITAHDLHTIRKTIFEHDKQNRQHRQKITQQQQQQQQIIQRHADGELLGSTFEKFLPSIIYPSSTLHHHNINNMNNINVNNNMNNNNNNNNFKDMNFQQQSLLPQLTLSLFQYSINTFHMITQHRAILYCDILLNLSHYLLSRQEKWQNLVEGIHENDEKTCDNENEQKQYIEQVLEQYRDQLVEDKLQNRMRTLCYWLFLQFSGVSHRRNNENFVGEILHMLKEQKSLFQREKTSHDWMTKACLERYMFHPYTALKWFKKSVRCVLRISRFSFI